MAMTNFIKEFTWQGAERDVYAPRKLGKGHYTKEKIKRQSAGNILCPSCGEQRSMMNKCLCNS